MYNENIMNGSISDSIENIMEQIRNMFPDYTWSTARSLHTYELILYCRLKIICCSVSMKDNDIYLDKNIYNIFIDTA